MNSATVLLAVVAILFGTIAVRGFTVQQSYRHLLQQHQPRPTYLLPLAATTTTTTKGYTPKWKKKETLGGGDAPDQVGLKGTIPVIFKQGNETRSTMAWAGQPLRDVASQAGQFIKYGCGKGECGTCECMVNGQWIRPCIAPVPPTSAQDGPVQVIVKQVKNKSKSSGKFYSVKSFFMGFYNNLLGMVGFVKQRRAAKKNWQERQEHEDLIRQRTLAKKQARQLEDVNGNLKP